MEGGYMGIKNTRRWGNILAAPQISRVSMRPAILLPGLYPREWKTLGPPKTCTWLFMTVFFFFFFLAAPMAYGAPRPGTISEPPLQTKLQLQQRRILSPPCRSRNRTCIPELPILLCLRGSFWNMTF